MNPATDSETPPLAEHPHMDRMGDALPPTNWREALLSLIASRVALIQLESKEAAGRGARAAILMVAAVICVFFTWALLLAGGIAGISVLTAWPWYWIAIVTAAVHLIAAIVLINAAKSPGQPSFPVTRSEFKKDREWIENLQKTRKSDA